MKHAKGYTIVVLIGLIAVMAAYQQGNLHADAAVAPAKVAVVDVTKVIKTCKKFKAWQEKKQLEVQQIESEFQAMQSELEALNNNLKIRTPGSEDYRSLSKDFIEKKAIMQSKDAAYKEIWSNEKEAFTEALYQEILQVIDEVAVQKGLDVVLADDTLDLQDPLRPDIMQTIVTKKLLYHVQKYDITEAVLAAIDAKK